jgi:hypothetical protein
VATGCVAVYAGWIAKRTMPAKAFAGSLALGYGALGLFGWFTDGLLMGSPFRIPLGAADNTFHLILAFGAAFTVAVAAFSAAARERMLAASGSESGEPSGVTASANAAVRRSRRPPHSLPRLYRAPNDAFSKLTRRRIRATRHRPAETA